MIETAVRAAAHPPLVVTTNGAVHAPRCRTCTRIPVSGVSSVMYPRRIAHLLVPLKQDDPAALVARREVVAGVVELDRRDDVGCV